MLDGTTAEIVERSVAHGQAVANHILAWAAGDGGAVIENLGFPRSYTPQQMEETIIKLLEGWSRKRQHSQER